MKITQKFLLFGLVPVLAQAGICIQMFSLLKSVEFYAEQEAKQSLIDRKLAESISQSVEVAVAAGAYAHYPLKVTADFFELACNRMESRLNELTELAKDDPDALADIQQLAVLGRETRGRYLAIKGADPTEPNMAMKEMNADAYKTGQIFLSRSRRITRILEREDERLEQTRKKSKAKRGEVKKLIWAELALCIGVLIIFYFLFRFDFARRFNDLLQIARDLAVDKPPSKTISTSDELGELSKALTDAAKMRREATAQKQILFQMVTHDLRSPLMAANILLDSLLNDTAATAEQKQMRLHNIERSLQRVIGLTNDLLTIEKLTAGAVKLQRVKVDFKETIDQAIETLQPLAEQNQCLIANHCPEMLVSVDEDRVLQVLVNLLTNAIKFSPPGSAVDVTANIDAKNAKNSTSAKDIKDNKDNKDNKDIKDIKDIKGTKDGTDSIETKDAKVLRVEVLDRGSGISEQHIQGLFSPFEQGTTENAAAGFGLGLSIAKLLAALHGGEIGANARPGGGMIFWFTLGI